MPRSEERRYGKAERLPYGHLVRAARLARGLTPKVLSARVGMLPSQLSDIERGIGSLSLRRAFQLATALDSTFIDVVRSILQAKLDEAGFTMLKVSISLVRDDSVTAVLPREKPSDT